MSNRNAFVLITITGLLFGMWFAQMQIAALTTQTPTLYPMSFFASTVFKCYLTILAFYFFTSMIFSYVAKHCLRPMFIAASFMPLLLVYAHISMPWIAGTILLLQIGYLFSILRADDYYALKKSYGLDIFVLLSFFILHLLITTRFSPLHWKMSMLVAEGYSSEEIPVVVSLFKGFILAKQFSFSYVDHAQWAGIMHPPVNFSSTLLQLITFIFDLPSINYDVFHQLISAIDFSLLIAGSFGLYLFLKYGANINSYFAFIGGYLFTFGGAPFLNQMFKSDGGYFLSSLVAFPYALLAISSAFKENEYRYALWAGVALASQFFMLAPHPEGTIYCLFYYAVFTLGLCLFTPIMTWSRRISLAAISVISFGTLSAFLMGPIVIDKLMGNMFVYAHTGDMAYTYYRYFAPYMLILYVSAPLAFLLFYIYDKLTPVFLSALLLSLCLVGTVSIVIDQHKTEALVHLLHLGLHVWCPPRTGVYVYTGVIIMAMYALDVTARFLFDLVSSKIFNYQAEQGKLNDFGV